MISRHSKPTLLAFLCLFLSGLGLIDNAIRLGNGKVKLFRQRGARRAALVHLDDLGIPDRVIDDRRIDPVFLPELMYGLTGDTELLTDRRVGLHFLLKFNELCFADSCHTAVLLSYVVVIGSAVITGYYFLSILKILYSVESLSKQFVLTMKVSCVAILLIKNT
jgi:hypothetical protein